MGVVNLNEVVRGVFQSAYLGYYVVAPYEGRGFMAPGLAAVIQRGFRGLKLHRLEANIMPHNLRSKALVQRLGFRFEGVARRYLKIAGRWRDHEHWALTAEDWRDRRRELG